MRRFFFVLLVLAVAGAPVSSQEAGDRVYNGSDGNHSVQTPLRVGDPQISLDGIVDEPAWEDAAVLTGFTQFDPSEGIPATQDTEVRVFVTDDAIWFAVKAFDESPEAIRATLAERDQIARNDDYVRVILDTFHDQRRAYVFTVNPFGVQQDGIWLEGGGGRRESFGPPIDDNPDFLWDSGGRVHDWGYAVEFKIPFKSIRFPKLESQSWGLQVTRRIQRNGFQQSWIPSFDNEPNKLSESGSLLALESLDPGLFLQVNPVFTGSRVGAVDSDGAFSREDPEGEFGLNLTYGLTSNLTLDGTVNPDFSQVEADAGQIAVNERFALFFPEQRPFFLEGTEIFGLPQSLVFTRTIANPIAGAKLTGKIGGATLGYLGAIDQYDDADDVLANLVRLRQDVGAASTVGGIYTDRTRSSDEYNRVAGIDGRFRLAGRYTLTAQGARSWDSDPGEASESGNLAFVQFQRAGRRFQSTAAFRSIDPEFRAESGFLRRTGEVQLELRDTRFTFFGAPGGPYESVGGGIEFQGIWDHEDFWAGRAPKEGQVQLQWTNSFRNNITVWITGQRDFFDYDPDAYEGLVVGNDGGLGAFRPDQDMFDGLYRGRIFAFFSGWEKVRGRISADGGETPIFDSRTGTPVEPADQLGGDISLSLFPTTFLRMELGLRHSRIDRQSDGSRYSEATIPRIRAQYQFSRSFFVRGIFEYSSQERGALLDPVSGEPLEYCSDGSCSPRDGSDENDFSIEALLAFEPSPGTVFFLGYSRLMEDIGSFRFEDIRTRQDGLFVKLSYLFRM